MHHSTLYGGISAGGFLGAEAARHLIPNICSADGSIFVRAAGMIMDFKGWSREGEKVRSWDMKPLGYDEAWEK